MHTTKHIKQSILILSFATLVAGCGGGSSSTSTGETTTTPTQVAAQAPTTAAPTTAAPTTTAPTTTAPTTTAPTTTAPTAKAVHSGQVKDSITGNSLANVNVSLGEATTTTDKDGFYTFSDLTASEEAVINFEKEGYFLGSTQIKLKALSDNNIASPNYLEHDIHAHDKKWIYNSTEEIFGSHIIIDDSVTYTNVDGDLYNGTISSELTILDITTNKDKGLFPGAFEGLNTNGTTVQFASYGLITLLLKDSNGNKLSLSDGEIATLKFDDVPSLKEQDTIPLWYYDYEQGLWFEEGYAELQEDGIYKGEVSHLGTWSLNRPIEEDPGIYRGRIVLKDGTPAQDVRIYATGVNWISSDLSTDEDGFFEIKVIPGNDFQLKVYDYKDKYGASYNSILPAIASGETVEAIN